MNYPRRYGWIPDSIDTRDHVLSIQAIRAEEGQPLPDRADLKPKLPPVWNQGQLGSCVAHGCAAAYQYLHPEHEPSRLFLYWLARERESTTGWDSGCMPRDCIKSMVAWGSAPEADWKYNDDDPGPYQNRPPDVAWVDAEQHQIIRYARVPQTLFSILGALASGMPIVFGFRVFPSFEADEVGRTGDIPYPKRDEKQIGGHCGLLVGYRDGDRVAEWRNSWGPGWGANGYGTIPYSMLLDPVLVGDLWVILDAE